MSTERHEIDILPNYIQVRLPSEFPRTFRLYFAQTEDCVARRVAGAIRQQSADIAELRAELNRERETNAVLRRDLAEPPPDIQELALKKCGHFEIVAKLRADLAAAVAERDSYRDEFSGLCHTLSVGSEGRPEMTAADWRKRVDDGVEFLLRPLIAQRDELVAAYEFARHVVRDDPGITPRGALIRQSDEIDRLRARLAALAELEKAASEPVAWMWDDMLGISHTYVSPKRPTWPDAGASPEMEMAINVRPLYAAPLAPFYRSDAEVHSAWLESDARKQLEAK